MIAVRYAPVAQMIESLDRYAQHHVEPGGFLRAVLENNLMEAMGRADDNNRAHLFLICDYIYNHLPGACHGHPIKVRDWLAVRNGGAA